MSRNDRETPGKARVCPHCRATILESASVCPACRHYVRFDPNGGQPAPPSFSPLRVEGTLSHLAAGGPLEYSVLLAIQDERGKEIARQVVGVGALGPAEERTFVLAVEVFAPRQGKIDEAALAAATATSEDT